MTIIKTTPKRTRQERKQARAVFERQHPVLSGIVRVVNYVPPQGTYTPALHVRYSYTHD